jgi:hypothetical protein
LRPSSVPGRTTSWPWSRSIPRLRLPKEIAVVNKGQHMAVNVSLSVWFVICGRLWTSSMFYPGAIRWLTCQSECLNYGYLWVVTGIGIWMSGFIPVRLWLLNTWMSRMVMATLLTPALGHGDSDFLSWMILWIYITLRCKGQAPEIIYNETSGIIYNETSGQILYISALWNWEFLCCFCEID